jgi:hypothetical protein
METSRVLVVDGDEGQRGAIVEALQHVVGSSQGRASLGAGAEMDGFDVVIANYDELDAADRELIAQRFSGPDRRGRLLLISAGKSQSELGALFGRHALTNLIARNGEVNADDLQVTVRKISSGSIFGMARYLPDAPSTAAFEVSRSEEKQSVIDRAEEFATAAGVHPRLVSQFGTVADELVTNALYNAPCDRAGGSRHAHLHRSDPVVLEAGERIVVKLASDGGRLGISAEDPFGSLSRERLLDYLARCFQAGKGRVERKQGGAGLGFYHIFDSVSHLVANLSPGKRTEIIGLIDTRGSYRAFAQGIKSFNLFLED